MVYVMTGIGSPSAEISERSFSGYYSMAHFVSEYERSSD